MTGRALITGISGFTGRYVRESLEALGYEVFGSSLTHCPDPYIFKADLCDLYSMRDLIETVMPDVVIHMGGVSNVACGNIDVLYQTNILGSRNLLQALSESKMNVKAIMMVSSAYVYGNNNSDLLSEQSKIGPTNDYAVSKLAMENICSLWGTELPIFVVRPFNYTGFGQSGDFLLPKLISHYAKKTKTISLGNLDVFREYNDVRTVAEIYTKLIVSKPVGKTINVCSGEVYSLKSILQIMKQIAGYEIEVEVDAKFIRKSETKILRGSNSLLQSLIGPIEFTVIEDTLRWMFQEAANENSSRN